MANIAIGATGEASTVVGAEVTVRHFHPDMPAVYGTPFMIYLMKVASAKAVEASLPPGWVTVGFEVSVRDLAATPIGGKVTARAKVVAVTEQLVTFEVEAHDGVNLIGRGTHFRAPVDLKRFEAALERQAWRKRTATA